MEDVEARPECEAINTKFPFSFKLNFSESEFAPSCNQNRFDKCSFLIVND